MENNKEYTSPQCKVIEIQSRTILADSGNFGTTRFKDEDGEW